MAPARATRFISASAFRVSGMKFSTRPETIASLLALSTGSAWASPTRTSARGSASAALAAAAKSWDGSSASRLCGLHRARIAAETEGFVKIVADKKYDEVLGVHMIGPRATELVAEATLALRLECTVEELIRTIHAHPTMSEAVGEAAHATHGAAIHA